MERVLNLCSQKTYIHIYIYIHIYTYTYIYIYIGSSEKIPNIDIPILNNNLSGIALQVLLHGKWQFTEVHGTPKLAWMYCTCISWLEY